MIYDRLVEILAEQFEVEKASITPETDVVNDLGADSLDFAEILAGVEDEFDLVITDDESLSISKVSEIVEYIEGLLK